MTIPSKRLLVKLAVLQAINLAALAFTTFQTTSSTTTRFSLVGSRHHRQWNTHTHTNVDSPKPKSSSSSSSCLSVASSPTDVDVDMPELGKEGVYHIMDERQYK
jgi:hypothetical protein